MLLSFRALQFTVMIKHGFLKFCCFIGIQRLHCLSFGYVCATLLAQGDGRVRVDVMVDGCDPVGPRRCLLARGDGRVAVVSFCW
jgi:hypothetical protein